MRMNKMTVNPYDYHMNVMWDKSKRVYEARCIEIPQCAGYHVDPKMALNEGFISIFESINRRDELDIAIPDVSMNKCPCCEENTYSNGYCYYCDYDKIGVEKCLT
jgi:hypothetical protein